MCACVWWQFYEFDQGEFFPGSPPRDFSMSDTGYVYVPTGCKSAKKSTCGLKCVTDVSQLQLGPIQKYVTPEGERGSDGCDKV